MKIHDTGRRICALLCSVLMCAGILSCCGKEEEQAQITLRTISVLGDAGHKQAYTALLEDFSADYPYVYHLGTVAETANAYMLYANFEDTYIASKYPHAVCYYTNAGMDEIKEHFVSVEEIRELYPDFASGITEASFDSVRSKDGKAYCVPFAGTWKGMALNNALMQSCSLSAPQSREELVSAAQTLSSKGAIPVACYPEKSAELLELLCISMGGESALDAVLRGEMPLDQLHSERWLRIFSAYAELCRAGAFPETAMTGELAEALMLKNTVSGSDVSFQQTELSKVQPDPYDLFNDGSAAMIITDNQSCGKITLDDYSLIMFPDYSSDSTDRAMVGGFNTGWYITRRAFNDKTIRDIVVAYVDAMTSVEASGRFAELGFIPSADIGQVQTQETEEEQVIPQYVENGLCDLADTTQCFIPSRITSVYSAAFSRLEHIAAALSVGAIEPDQAVELINDPAMTLIDVVERSVRPVVSDSDLTVSGGDAAASGSDAMAD